MNISRIGLQIFLIALFGIFPFRTIVSQNSVEGLLIAEAEKLSGDNFPFSTKSPGGATVYAASKIDFKMLSAIDKGLTDLFYIAKKQGFTSHLEFSDYTIFIAKSDRNTNSNGEYSPDIAVSAAQYAGSEYDQGGFIYAAGIIVANSPCAFMIAEHNKDFARVSDVVRFEGEHLVLYHNDRGRYLETADHSRGGGHPILK